MDEELKCPDCDFYLDYDARIDDEFDGSFYNSLWEGHCSECFPGFLEVDAGIQGCHPIQSLQGFCG